MNITKDICMGIKEINKKTFVVISELRNKNKYEVQFQWLDSVILGAILFNICFNNMDTRLEGISSKFPKDTKLGGALN